MHIDGKLFDTACDLSYAFVCELDCPFCVSALNNNEDTNESSSTWWTLIIAICTSAVVLMLCCVAIALVVAHMKRSKEARMRERNLTGIVMTQPPQTITGVLAVDIVAENLTFPSAPPLVSALPCVESSPKEKCNLVITIPDAPTNQNL